jgi:plastocyanin
MKAEFSIGGPSLPVISRAPSNTVGPWANKVSENTAEQQTIVNLRIRQSIFQSARVDAATSRVCSGVKETRLVAASTITAGGANGEMPNLVLWLEAAMATGLLVGALLARMRRFRVHGWVQGMIVTGNVLLIATVMVPSLYRFLGSSSPTPRIVLVHAIAGSVAELLGLYVVLCAGLGWIPLRFRFTNFKPWMRLTLAAWLVAFGLGAWTYQTLNGGSSAPPSPPASASNAQITVKNFAFDPADLTVSAGTEVEWTDVTGRHTVQADDGSFKSETLTAGGTFKHRFERPGVYRYFCEFHGTAGGHDMAGVVNVR